MDHPIIYPNIIKKTQEGDKFYDLPSYFLKERKIFLNDEINYQTSNSLILQLLFLDRDSSKEIDFYINSPGGSIVDGLAIYDIIRTMKSKVNTICIGHCASMAAVLLAAGTGKRKAYQNSRIMIHQPSGGIEGQSSDIEIYVKEMLKLKHIMNKILIEKTILSEDEISFLTDRDKWYSPEEALKIKLIDQIL